MTFVLLMKIYQKIDSLADCTGKNSFITNHDSPMRRRSCYSDIEPGSNGTLGIKPIFWCGKFDKDEVLRLSCTLKLRPEGSSPPPSQYVAPREDVTACCLLQRRLPQHLSVKTCDSQNISVSRVSPVQAHVVPRLRISHR
jgi:hypothetical protein